MRNSIVYKIILGLSGLLLLVVGSMLTFNTEAALASSGIELGENVSMYNDIRGGGGLVLALGLLILLGAFIRKLAFTSTVTAIFTYLGYAAGRVISIGFDGPPSEALIRATVIEGVFGVLTLFAFFKYRERT